ncbi:MAG: xanthine dehydrogenase family protein subunit M [Hyphomicrobiales bacterium]|nr:xanthine dehydrogenase family protein subunit M [Hyphomicrobiales bacterium]
MLLVLPEFDLLATDSIEETCSLLDRYGGDARVLAGGTDLLVKMKLRRLKSRCLINIKRIPQLDLVRHDERTGLHIGSLVTAQALKDSSVIAGKFPLLNQAAGKLGTLQIRHIATLGGNLANASPSAEFAPVLMTLGATVHCQGRRGPRAVPIDTFFQGPGQSALGHDEVIVDIHVPVPAPNAAGLYLKYALRRMDVAVAAVAVTVRFEEGVCRDAKIALGAVAPTPVRALEAEAVLKGAKVGNDGHVRELIEEVAALASQASRPIDDFRSDADFRRQVVGKLVRQALRQLIARARP